MSRLVIVSNRLPITVRTVEGMAEVVPSDGGLASTVSFVQRGIRSVWVGYLGEAPSERLTEVARGRHYHPVAIPEPIYRGYYDEFANRVLWPVLHGFAAFGDPKSSWGAYQQANQIFADYLLEMLRPGDLVWVHDYHLFPLPGMLRAGGFEGRIGFFLHIPFPSPERFRLIPQHESLLGSLSQADLVGLQTEEYLQNFRASLPRGGSFSGVFPIGIAFEAFDQVEPEEAVFYERLGETGGETREILSLSRLDYTKGVVEQLGAIRQLAADPALEGSFQFKLQIIPSRHTLPEYRKLKGKIENLVEEINSQFGGAWTPIRYDYGQLSQSELRAAYRSAEVMLVTPLRDGMNLVAKEYLAANPRGHLILSKFAGSAEQLRQATLVDPKDPTQLETAIRRALSSPPPLQANVIMRRGLRRDNVYSWAEKFIRKLREAGR